MIKKHEITIKEAINKMIKNYKLDNKLNITKIESHWEDIVGKIIAKHTIKLELKHKKLYVKLDSSVIRQELQFHRTKIIDSIKQKFGEDVINDVIFF